MVFIVIFTYRAGMMATKLHTHCQQLCSVRKFTTATCILTEEYHTFVINSDNVQTQPTYSKTHATLQKALSIYNGKQQLSLFQYLQVCVNTRLPPHQPWTCQPVNMHTIAKHLYLNMLYKHLIKHHHIHTNVCHYMTQSMLRVQNKCQSWVECH